MAYNANGSSERYIYTYNADGLLEKVWINGMKAGYFYTYDEDGNPVSTEFKYTDGTYPIEYKTLLTIRAGEDGEEKIGFGYEFGSVKLGYAITTEENSVTTRLDNIKNEENPTGIFEKTSTTDALGRTVSEVLEEIRSGSKISVTYEYVRGTVTDANGNAAATDLVEKITFSDGAEIAYTYDANGNILTESRKRRYSSKPLALSESYSYDALGQLVRHDSVSQNKTFVFEYDKNGNILSKKEYAYTTGSLPSEPVSSVVYGYSDTSWKDKLTSYNGKEITYDANGNPLSYRDGISLSWNGRRLARFSRPGVSPTNYTYNEDGIRVMKDFGGIKTRYLLDGTNIIAQEVTNGDSLDYIYFLYDASGSPVGMNYLGYNYYYKKNLQGDIIEIWGTEDGTASHDFRLLVEYTYDAWGNVTKMLDLTNSWYRVGTANPFRYRGYYYDNESGLYYVSSRYYDPEIGRWLNSDDPMFLGATGSITSYNLYVYCENNPINMVDLTGNIATNVIGAIIGGVIGAVGGAFLGKWLADRLGITGFWARTAFIGAVGLLVGAAAAAIGYFIGPYVAKAWSVWSAKLSGLIKGTFKSIAKITAKTMSHINVSKHLWNKVMKKVTKTQIETLIYQGIRKGTWNLLTNGSVKILYKYGGQIIVITGKVVNNIFRIGDAWVWNGLRTP